jgi:hypothetical protein
MVDANDARQQMSPKRGMLVVDGATSDRQDLTFAVNSNQECTKTT